MSKARRHPRDGAALPPLQQALARLTGARLCYAKPVTAGGRTIIAVASVRTAGGFGFGRSHTDAAADGSGGGGGGTLDARPVGFIEIDNDGARFHSIDDRRLPVAAIGGGALAALVLQRRLTRRRRAGLAVGSRRLNAFGRRRLRRVPPVGLPAPVRPR
jgi:hypothetical protein